MNNGPCHMIQHTTCHLCINQSTPTGAFESWQSTCRKEEIVTHYVKDARILNACRSERCVGSMLCGQPGEAVAPSNDCPKFQGSGPLGSRQGRLLGDSFCKASGRLRGTRYGHRQQLLGPLLNALREGGTCKHWGKIVAGVHIRQVKRPHPCT